MGPGPVGPAGPAGPPCASLHERTAGQTTAVRSGRARSCASGPASYCAAATAAIEVQGGTRGGTRGGAHCCRRRASASSSSRGGMSASAPPSAPAGEQGRRRLPSQAMPHHTRAASLPHSSIRPTQAGANPKPATRELRTRGKVQIDGSLDIVVSSLQHLQRRSLHTCRARWSAAARKQGLQAQPARRRCCRRRVCGMQRLRGKGKAEGWGAAARGAAGGRRLAGGAHLAGAGDGAEGGHSVGGVHGCGCFRTRCYCGLRLLLRCPRGGEESFCGCSRGRGKRLLWGGLQRVPARRQGVIIDQGR